MSDDIFIHHQKLRLINTEEINFGSKKSLENLPLSNLNRSIFCKQLYRELFLEVLGFIGALVVALRFFLAFISKISNYFGKILVNEKLSPSNNPKSDNFRFGITKSAINERLMKGEANVQPNCLANLSIAEYSLATS